VSSYPEHRLLDSQWDSVYEVVRGAKFDPLEFKRGKTVGATYNGVVPELTHRPTDSKFVFDFDPRRNEHGVAYTPGEEKPWDIAGSFVQWFDVILHVRIWLQNVERERSTPNLWAMLDEQRRLLAASEPTGDTANNTPFGPEEQAQIAAQLIEIRNLLVHTHGADPKALESRVEQLTDASTRLGRREWLTIFLGTIFTWTLEGLIPPAGAREVLTLAAQTLGHLFGGGVPQLPMP
jgi:hypothetical protein